MCESKISLKWKISIFITKNHYCIADICSPQKYGFKIIACVKPIVILKWIRKLKKWVSLFKMTQKSPLEGQWLFRKNDSIMFMSSNKFLRHALLYYPAIWVGERIRRSSCTSRFSKSRQCGWPFLFWFLKSSS